MNMVGKCSILKAAVLGTALSMVAACSEGGTENSAAAAGPDILETWEQVMVNIRNCDQAYEQMVSAAELWEGGSGSREAVDQALANAEQVCTGTADQVAQLEPPEGAGGDNQVGFGSALDTCESAARTRLEIFPLLRQLLDGQLEDQSRLEAIGQEHEQKSTQCGFSFAKQAQEAGVDPAELERIADEVMGGRAGQSQAQPN